MPIAVSPRRSALSIRVLALAAAGLAAAPAAALDRDAPLLPAAAVNEAAPEATVFTFGDIEVVGPWTRANRPGQNVAAVYLGLRNKGTQEIGLASVATPAARTTALRELVDGGGFPKMQDHPGPILVPPGGEVALKPGGKLIMLVGLTQMLRAGKTIPVTLTFTDGSEAKVDVIIWDASTMYGQ